MAAKQMVAEIHAEVPDNGVPALPPNSNGVTALIQMAIAKMDGENGPSIVQTLNGLYDLHVKEQTRQAEMAFFDAFAQFQKRCPSIEKTKSSKKLDQQSGGRFDFKYAPLDEISSVVNPILSDLGLSYTWDTVIDNGQMRCVCTVRHIQGHSVSASFQCPISSNLPVGDQQKWGAVNTYARRYSLIQALGLTTTDEDPDANTGVDRTPEKISIDQQVYILDLIRETKADEGKFLNFFKIVEVQDLPATKYEQAVQMLEAKRKKVA